MRDESGLKPIMTEIGNGNLDWDSIIKTAEKVGVKHYVVEQDAYFTESPFNSLKMSADFLKKYRA
jgi:sugar phosphate isomerase/epimerase